MTATIGPFQDRHRMAAAAPPGGGNPELLTGRPMTAIASGVAPDTAELLEALGRTTDGMMAVDPGMRIIAWNQAATELLGSPAAEVMGRTCYDVLGWFDRYGNAVCDATCPACGHGSEGRLIQTREVMGHRKSGEALWLSVSTLVLPGRHRAQCPLVHLVREGGLPPNLEQLIVERVQRTVPQKEPEDSEVAQALAKLTQREREVLHLLTDGMDTRSIARHLTLSPATVRNHIQHILTKLRVRSRLEAVALTLRHPGIRERHA